ncbi:helix-turn-helix domain-containing protein [Gracilibacillus phocaeensis]|uniref:helix-turn-helix domain-containing protein n=1 Tax=Gracilibacillus phocaeensis TaxID=2042304 RepID=UPI00102F678D|nr:helix-turn-helix domain-containing protein [Gracilibacillus phocaeensis]
MDEYMTIAETVDLLHNYEVDCDEKDVYRWIAKGEMEATEHEGNYYILELDMLDFLIDLSNVGTAYEKGINNETKIVRLEKRIQELEKKIDSLRCEKVQLELRLGILPF